MQKKFLLGVLLLVSLVSSAQTNRVTVNVFAAVHQASEFSFKEPLKVFFTLFPGDSTSCKKEITATYLRENVFEFELPKTRIWHIGFSLGEFSYEMMCVNNSDGEAEDRYSFNLLLQHEKKDFKQIKFLPPCFREE